jgi:hypothetical protein
VVEKLLTTLHRQQRRSGTPACCAPDIPLVAPLSS